MSSDAMVHQSDGAAPSAHPHAFPDVDIPAGRRISLLAWSLAGLAGLAVWVLIFKLI